MVPESLSPLQNPETPSLRPWCTPTLLRLNGAANTDKWARSHELTVTTTVLNQHYKFGPGGVIGPNPGPS